MGIDTVLPSTALARFLVATPLTSRSTAVLSRARTPFTLHLAGAAPEAQELECLAVVRSVPSKRIVCAGTWRGEDVFAKIYFHRWHAHRHWRREENGIRALSEKGILVPALLYSGKGRVTDSSVYVLVFKAITPAESLQTAWDTAADPHQKTAIMHSVVRLIAGHHRVGLMQKDLHLNNFLKSAQGIFTLDGSSIQTKKSQFSERACLNNLAMILSQMQFDSDPVLEQLYRQYVSERGWSYSTVAWEYLRKRIAVWRRRLKRNMLKKIFRDCSAYVCERGLRRFMVCKRQYFSPAMRGFVDHIDQRFESECRHYLKRGRSSTVGVVQVDGRSLVVKRYNIKGFWHGLSRACRPTRAARSWTNAHVLGFHDIPTAEPIAMVEDRRMGLLRGRSYFVSEQLQGRNAEAYFRAPGVDRDERERNARALWALLRRLREVKLSHGDMKATNFVIRKQGPTIVDLDGLIEHHSLWRASAGHEKDIRRFMRNWRGDGDLERLFASAHVQPAQPGN